MSERKDLKILDIYDQTENANYMKIFPTNNSRSAPDKRTNISAFFELMVKLIQLSNLSQIDIMRNELPMKELL